MQPVASSSATLADPEEGGKTLHKRRKTNHTPATPENVIVPTTQQKRAGKQRKIRHLSNLIEMPLDILFDIFGHLLPLDILHLSRTTKEFRRVLMHPSSVSVWKSAQANVPNVFPDCPPDLTEPQWASLAFDSYCNICLTPNIRTVDWHLRVRLCKKCITDHVIDRWGLAKEYTTDGSFDLTGMVPFRTDYKRGRLYIYDIELDAVRRKYNSIVDPEARQAYVDERKTLVKEIMKHAHLCEEWADTKAQDRSQELEDLRQSRKEAIIERLTAVGWGEEIQKLLPGDSIGNHKLAREPKLLTDRIWKRIGPPLVAYMEEKKVQRLERERLRLIVDRKRFAVDVLRAYKNSHLPCTEVMPGPVDFCLFPEIKVVLELPTEVDVDESSFVDVVPVLPDILSRWRTEINNKLIKTVKWQLYDPEMDDPTNEEVIQKMKLATTVFQCASCTSDKSFDDEELMPWDIDSDSDDSSICNPFTGYPILSNRSDKSDPLFYPRVLGHRCLTNSHRRYGLMSWNDVSVSLNYLSGSRGAWSSSYLKVNKNAERAAEAVIKACGLDPTTVTSDDLDRVDARLACLDCIHRSGYDATLQVEIFGWRSAIQHHGQMHFGTCISWEMLSDPVREQALRIEALLGERLATNDILPLPSNLVVWACAHCRDLPSERDLMDLKQVEAHVTVFHRISEPKLNEDFYESFEGPQAYRTDTMPNYSLITIPAKDDESQPGPSCL